MLADTMVHLCITDLERLMGTMVIESEVVGEKHIEFSFDIIVVHLM